jgi:dTDP-glucose 4,6-dehydratase|tara:strand:- start:8545 stop:9594 length:1050 start_codon:yes stop_codon:yes gene_type:complete
MTHVLLTGIGGFIGSHTAEWILRNTDWHLVGIDSWKASHKADRQRLTQVLGDLDPEMGERLSVYTWDLAEEFSESFKGKLERDLGDNSIDYIISMASDSHVTRSISDPGTCWLNNCKLVYNMLELARWASPGLKKFIQVSTDEVYGDAGWDGPGHVEWDTILPSNPYSASKAAQEALCISYWRTYLLPIMITNTMNVIGEMQDPEKFLPKALVKITEGDEMTIHGDSPDRIAKRVWLDAKNMAAALTYICRNVEPTSYELDSRPKRFHVIGDTELDVLALAHRLADKLDKPLKYTLVRGDAVRPGYDRRYALIDNNLRAEGFKAPFTFDDTLERIIRWYNLHPEWLWDS